MDNYEMARLARARRRTILTNKTNRRVSIRDGESISETPAATSTTRLVKRARQNIVSHSTVHEDGTITTRMHDHNLKAVTNPTTHYVGYNIRIIEEAVERQMRRQIPGTLNIILKSIRLCHLTKLTYRPLNTTRYCNKYGNDCRTMYKKFHINRDAVCE